ncbi:hypothetical protein GCM10025865_00610 [Paraoerskovia sediminicola]|uniref:Secreted protein n=1 Tax=Paraoerskovia sediminicola TaxID=1138587 RepID=A0ABN6X7Q5_9CELL|nr:hypothetical protein [Paraoerskovia sediminicola]BDZ40762.1 hypothetical protein GCM10025865_00610 [Paraoerskovia sediminicola]
MTAPAPPTIEPPAAADPRTAEGPGRGGRTGRLLESLSRTPGQLRVALAVAVLACVLVALVGFRAGTDQSDSVDAARNGADRSVALQEVRADLVTADATAANAFLVGGLEPTAQREDYDTRIEDAAAGLAGLARTGTVEDAGRIGEVSADLTEYTGLVEQARANNRQGFPVGSAYLDSASTLLREEMLPMLDELGDDASARTDARFDDTATALLLLALCLLGLLALVAVQVWLARRTHRVLNVGLATATAIVLITGVLGTALLASVRGTAVDVRSGPYTSATALAAAESAANGAKSSASLGLIKRGSGEEIEVQVDASLDEAFDALSEADASSTASGLADDLQAWSDEHDEIRALDADGEWEAAVAAAVDDAPGASNDLFDQYVSGTEEAIVAEAETVDSELVSAADRAGVGAWGLLIGGLVGAVAAWRGLHQRIEEYR